MTDTSEIINSISHDTDKSKLLEANNHIFRNPKQFKLYSIDPDTETKLIAKRQMGDIELESDCTAFSLQIKEPLNRELAERLNGLQKRTTKLRAEVDRRKLSITRDHQHLYKDSKNDVHVSKTKALDNYFDSLNNQITDELILSNLVAKQSLLERTFELNEMDSNQYKSMDRRLVKHIASKTQQKEKEIEQSRVTLRSRKKKGVKKAENRRSRYYTPGNISVFGCKLESYIKASGYSIPPVMSECIKVINVYGMFLNGIFRIPGGNAEVEEMKKQFESGENPLLEYNPDDIG